MFTYLGTKPEDLFETINAFDKPVAAASLGQVYKARLKSTGIIYVYGCICVYIYIHVLGQV
jgi:predicted unusual protein kinase regulating ubiquinone biosynthesis (AarF/ABC1/UbiB family)